MTGVFFFVLDPSTQNGKDLLMKNRLNIVIIHSSTIVTRKLKFHSIVYAEDNLSRKNPVKITLAIPLGTLLGLSYLLTHWHTTFYNTWRTYIYIYIYIYIWSAYS